MSAWPSARSSTKREHGRIVQRGLKDEDGHTTLDTAFLAFHAQRRRSILFVIG